MGGSGVVSGVYGSGVVARSSDVSGPSGSVTVVVSSVASAFYRLSLFDVFGLYPASFICVWRDTLCAS